MFYVNTAELEKEFASENSVHRDYLILYHVAKCPGNICSILPCLFYHNGENRRRRPFRFSNGAWSYKPQLCASAECEFGETCIYAHNSDEFNYHPMIYKTIRCSHPLNDGICSNFGEHCPWSHDIVRQPSPYFLKGPREMKIETTIEGQREDNIRNQKFHSQYKSNQDSIVKKPKNTVNNFELETFKVYPCPDYKYHDEARCTGYHYDSDCRRDPKKFRYSADPCPIAYDPTTKQFDYICPKGNKCDKAHSRVECFYHIDFFRKNECKDLDCKLGDACPFIHGEPVEEIDYDFEMELKNMRDKNNLLKTLLNNLKSITVEREKFKCHFCRNHCIEVVFQCGHAACRECNQLCTLCNVNKKTTIKIKRG